MLRSHGPASVAARTARRRGPRRGRGGRPARGELPRPADLPLPAGEHRVLGHRDPGGQLHHGLRDLRRDARTVRVRLPPGQHRADAVRLRDRAPAAAHPRGEGRRSRRSSRSRCRRRRGSRRSTPWEPGHYPLHVRFSDVDVYGHVNNVKYFEYFQEARIPLIRPRSRTCPSAGDFRRRGRPDRRRLQGADPVPARALRRAGRASPTSGPVVHHRVGDPRRRDRAVAGARSCWSSSTRRPSARSSRRRRTATRCSARRRPPEAVRQAVSLERVDHELRGVGDVVPELLRPARASGGRRRARRGSAPASAPRRRASPRTARAASAAAGGRGVSEYVVGPPQYWMRNSAKRSSAGPRSSSG